MTRGDQLIERAANRLESFARHSASEPGMKGKLAEPLADDADLLRGMRPSRIAARLRGRPDGEATEARKPLPQVEPERRREPSGRRRPPAIALAVGAFALGVLIAKVVDWRGHAHPR